MRSPPTLKYTFANAMRAPIFWMSSDVSTQSPICALPAKSTLRLAVTMLVGGFVEVAMPVAERDVRDGREHAAVQRATRVRVLLLHAHADDQRAPEPALYSGPIVSRNGLVRKIGANSGRNVCGCDTIMRWLRHVVGQRFRPDNPIAG